MTADRTFPRPASIFYIQRTIIAGLRFFLDNLIAASLRNAICPRNRTCVILFYRRTICRAAVAIIGIRIIADLFAFYLTIAANRLFAASRFAFRLTAFKAILYCRAVCRTTVAR